MMQSKNTPEETDGEIVDQEPGVLTDCPRCSEPISELIWGQTNCPRCGLHFECC